MQILVASANIFRRELTCYMLVDAGYQVVEAANKTTLLTQLNTMSPDLLVIDRAFDGLPASEIVPLVRTRSSCPICWLGTIEHASELRGANGPEADYLLWPYESEELLRCVARHELPLRERCVGADE